jgi:hypothetical protein
VTVLYLPGVRPVVARPWSHTWGRLRLACSAIRTIVRPPAPMEFRDQVAPVEPSRPPSPRRPRRRPARVIDIEQARRRRSLAGV